VTTEQHFATSQIHGGGAVPAGDQLTAVVPIYQSAAYRFESTQHAEEVFSLTRQGNLYSRTANPTSLSFERRVAALEGGVSAIATASGQSAVFIALIALVRAGDHVVASSSLYGGTLDLLLDLLPDFGITTTLVDQDDPEEWRAAVRPTTRAFFGETLSNPAGKVLDIETIAAIAHEVDVPLVVDSTLASPALLRPLDFGADIVVHSATKILGGHGSALGGVVVDGGRFDFGRVPGRWPQFTEPYARYGDLVLWDAFGAAGGAYGVLLRTKYLHDIGPSATPFSSFLILQGIETLDLRVSRQNSSALAIAQWLAQHPAVASVNYAGLPASPQHALAQKYLPRGAGSVLSFDVVGGEAVARTAIDALQLFTLAANIGDARSLVIHTATTTHSHLDDAGLADAGASRATVRLSIGLEDPADLIRDLERALDTTKDIR